MTSFMTLQSKEGFYLAGLLVLIHGCPNYGDGNISGFVSPAKVLLRGVRESERSQLSGSLNSRASRREGRVVESHLIV